MDAATEGDILLQSAGAGGGRDGSGTVRQRFDYYPYGTVSRVWTGSTATDSPEKRYRFDGKETAGNALTDPAFRLPLRESGHCYCLILDLGRIGLMKELNWCILD